MDTVYEQLDKVIAGEVDGVMFLMMDTIEVIDYIVNIYNATYISSFVSDGIETSRYDINGTQFAIYYDFMENVLTFGYYD